MSKIALITDTHFGSRGDSEIFHEYFARFYKYVFFPYLKENNINTIVHLGDIMDRRKYVNFRTLDNFIKTFIEPICKRNINIHLIIGNHDTSFKNTNSLNSPKCLIWPKKNIHIYSEIEEISIDGNTNILFVPWINEENEKNVFEQIQKTKAKIVMGHLEIKGFSMYKGHTSDIGYESKLFSKFKRVMTGHYHHRSTKKNINYLGCPYEITWSDWGDPKGFHIFDTRKNELEFIPNPLRIFEKIYYDENSPDVVVKDKYVKLVVVNKTDKKKFDEYINKLQEQEPHSMTIIEDFSDDIKVDDDTNLNLEEDTLTFLNSYVDGIKKESKEKTKIKSIMQKIYVEAMNV